MESNVKIKGDLLDSTEKLFFIKPSYTEEKELFIIINANGSFLYIGKDRIKAEYSWRNITGRSYKDYGLNLPFKYRLYNELYNFLTKELGFFDGEDDNAAEMLLEIVAKHLRKHRKMIEYLKGKIESCSDLTKEYSDCVVFLDRDVLPREIRGE